MKKLICAVGLSVVSAVQAGVVRYVDDDAAPAGDGLTWATAHRFLQDALVGVADGTEIRVAQGVYKPDRDEANPGGTGDRLLWFDLGFDNDCCFPHSLATCTDEACETLVCAVDPLCCDCCINDWEQACADLAAMLCGDTCQVTSGIALIGGYAGLGAPDPDARDPDLYLTVLTGDLLDNDVPMPEIFDPSVNDNSLHVITANGSDLVIDGFDIRGGASNTTDEQVPMRWGAGLLVIEGNVTVQSCTFTGNVDSSDGGAIALYRGTAVMTDCTVTGNRGGAGGGILLIESSLTLINCEISSNISGNQGAGVYASQSELVAIDSTFSDNINETNRGGGIHARQLSTVTLTGCTFSGNDGGIEGGGLYLKLGSCTATKCTFVGNTAGWGGGVFLESTIDSLTIVDCTFDSNTAGLGGALSNDGGQLTVTGTLFTGNTANNGGAVMGNANGTYRDCIFVANSSTAVGGAFNEEAASTLTNCLFVENGSNHGGAMYLGSFAGPDLIDCTFLGNVAGADGGAVGGAGSIHPRFANCLFTGNTAVDKGGASSFRDAEVVFSNCTIAANTTPGQAGGIFIKQGSTAWITSCIAWNNTDASGSTEPAQVTSESSTLLVAYSCIEGLTGALGGAGNIGTDPMFVDMLGPDGLAGTEDDDLHLQPSSPSIDAGDSTAVLLGITTDLDGNPRFVDDLATMDTSAGVCPVDMGAYEFEAGLVVSCCPWDCGDGDGNVGIVDFLALLGQWSMVGTSCDFGGGNPGVDIVDFLELLGRWGDCS